MAPILSIRNLSTGYGKKQVLFDVCMDVMPGEIVLITGGNGSGKSTLLRAIYGLVSPWNLDARILFRPDPAGPVVSTNQPTNNLRNGLAYLPQKNAVFDDLTVEDNLRLSGDTIKDQKEFHARRDAVLVSLPALKPLLSRKPDKMSGGERQLVAIGMVLLHRPKLLLLDEPLAGLSKPVAVAVCQQIATLRDEMGIAVAVVEHRLRGIDTIAGRTIVFRLGQTTES